MINHLSSDVDVLDMVRKEVSKKIDGIKSDIQPTPLLNSDRDINVPPTGTESQKTDKVHTPQPDREEKNDISVCCNAPTKVHSEEEGTNYYKCTKCGKPCDLIWFHLTSTPQDAQGEWEERFKYKFQISNDKYGRERFAEELSMPTKVKDFIRQELSTQKITLLEEWRDVFVREILWLDHKDILFPEFKNIEEKFEAFRQYQMSKLRDTSDLLIQEEKKKV